MHPLRGTYTREADLSCLRSGLFKMQLTSIHFMDTATVHVFPCFATFWSRGVSTLTSTVIVVGLQALPECSYLRLKTVNVRLSVPNDARCVCELALVVCLVLAPLYIPLVRVHRDHQMCHSPWGTKHQRVVLLPPAICSSQCLLIPSWSFNAFFNWS